MSENFESWAVSPATKILDAEGRDWSWAYVIFGTLARLPGYAFGSDGSIWSRWVRAKHTQKPGATYEPTGSTWRRLREKGETGKYRRANLTIDGTITTVLIHRLILEAFRGPCPEGMEACHGHGGLMDNRLANLRWGTHASNISDKKQHGTEPRGERNPGAKLTRNQVVEIRKLAGGGESHGAVARRFGVGRTTVDAIVSRKTWGHVPAEELLTETRS